MVKRKSMIRQIKRDLRVTRSRKKHTTARIPGDEFLFFSFSSPVPRRNFAPRECTVFLGDEKKK